MRTTYGRLLAAASGLAALAIALSMPVQATSAQRPAGLSPAIESLTGRDTYDRYCAGCHGRTGKGDGPVAASLKTKVPDLTSMAVRNGGTFPRERARAAVVNTERPVTAHGTGDMPVWGFVFKVLEPSDARADVRIDNVVAYIEALQEPPIVSLAAGRQVFISYCASCHGPEGRGGGPVASRLPKDVPDLTQFAVRNRGLFPSERVRQIIDGRGIASHGTREMPIWGDAFRSAPGRPDARGVAARISAVTVFLESIQVRNGE